MKYASVFTVFVCLSQLLYAQIPGGGGRPNFNSAQYNVGHFYGKILDAKSGKPVEFATVQLFQSRMDSVTKTFKPVLASGALTGTNGEFSLENLAVLGEYTLRITALGYDSLVQKISFGINMNAIQQGNWQKALNGVDKDLGNLKLNPMAIQLGEVVVTGEEPLYRLELDKKVYNVEKDPSSAGGTAEDVLRKIPSVSVDLDGNVTMRSAAPQIFVDGRPSTLTVDQIPADVIEKIEVITNPSAKYDASGGQAGILNIVLKKNRRIGYHGSVRAGVDMRGKVNGGGDINVRPGKVNLFATANFNQRKSKSFNTTDRYNLVDSPLTNIFQEDTSVSSNLFGFGSMGLDYFMDNRNTVSLSGTYSKGEFNPITEIFLTTDTLVDTGTKTSYTTRHTDNIREFENMGGALSFKHLFPREGREWTADINYNQSQSNNLNLIKTHYYDMLFQQTGNVQQEQRGEGINRYLTAQTDYEDPVTENMKLEAGARIAVRNFTSENHVFVLDYLETEFVEVPDINNYKYDDQVYAAYVTFSNKMNKLQYQLGLRAESSFYTGLLTDIDQSFRNDYPVSLFPSGFLSYPLSSKSDVQLNYSRRIDRPGFFQLMPFTDYSDSLNLSRGNPDLRPQFTNTVELSYQKNFDRTNTLLATIYFKNTNDLITRVQELQYDSAFGNDVIINTWENANSSYLTGIEITSTNSIQKWLTLTANMNFFQSYIDGENIEVNLTNKQLSWLADLEVSFKLPENFSIQLSGDYQSKTSVPQSGGGGGGMGRMFGGGGGGFFGGSPATLQGYVKPVSWVDLSFRKEFLKNKNLAVTLNFNDIFATRKYITYYDTDFFTQTSTRVRDPQFIRLNVSWRFGKFDTSLFKRKNLKNTGEMIPDMGGIQ